MKKYNKSLQELEEDCRSHMAANNLPYAGQILANGKIQRYSADNKQHEKDEWYIAFEGTSLKGNAYLSCTYGSWSQGNKYEYSSYESQSTYIDTEERKEQMVRRRQEQALAASTIKRVHEKVARNAREFWAQSLQNPPEPQTEYLLYAKAKGISPIGVRFGPNPSGYPSIIIPLHNTDEVVQTLQYISMDTTGKSHKYFLKGGEKRGNFFTLGSLSNTKEIFVVEGYATGVSVYNASNKVTVIAFDAGNMVNVVEAIKEKFPVCSITIAGDNDTRGKEAAIATAKKFGCKVVFPEFPDDKAQDSNGKSYTDFNDLQQVFGIEEVKRQLSVLMVVTSDDEERKQIATVILKQDDPCGNFSTSTSLPPPLRNLVEAICKTTQAHPIMIIGSILATASATLKKNIFVSRQNYFQDLYPNLWILNIARSGQFKSTALKKGGNIAYKKASDIRMEIKQMLEKERRENDPKAKEDIRQGILVLQNSNVILPNKMTGESFIEILSEGREGVIFTNEFGAWLMNLEKKCNNDFKGILTELYDVPFSYEYRTKTQGDFILTKPYFSIFGVSTLAWLQSNLRPDDVSGGFFARFLIFTPPGDSQIPPALPLHNNATEIDEAEKEVKEILDSIQEPREFTLTNDAKSTFDGMHKQLYSMVKFYSESCQEILQPFLMRWSPYLLKLANIYQVFIDHYSSEISVTALGYAWDFLEPSVRSTAQLYEKELGESDLQRKCRLIEDMICQKVADNKGKPMRRQDILASKKLPGGAKEYDYVLETLEEQGKVTVEKKDLKNEWLYSPARLNLVEED